MTRWLLALALLFPASALAAESDTYWLGGTSSTGVPIFIPVSPTNPMPVTGTGSGTPITIQGSSTPSPGNSTTTPLAGGATFTGTAVDISTYSQVQVYVKSDQASAVGGVQLQFSPDGTTWGDTSIYDFTPGSGNNLDQSYNAGSRAKFFRFVYTNGATPQGSVLISTLLRGQNALGDFVDMSVPPSQFGHGQVTSSVISGTGGKGPVLLHSSATGRLDGVITWIAPTSGSVTTSGVVVAAGPTVSVITNTTGGARLTLNVFGGAAVDNVGIPLNAGERVTISGQPSGTAINGICSSGTCTFTAQSGS
jgi:hypothetical protein